MNEHLAAVKKFHTDDNLSEEERSRLPRDYDGKLLSTAINEIVEAEIALADNSARELMATAISQRLQKHGGPVGNDRFKQIIKDVAEDKVEQGIVGAYLDEWGERRYAAGVAEGEAKAQSKDAAWRRAETAAIRAELMKERDLEPDSGRPSPAGSKKYADMMTERDLTPDERDAETQRFLQTARA